MLVDIAGRDDIPALTGLLAILFAQEREFHPYAQRQAHGLNLILAQPTLGAVLAARTAAGAPPMGMAVLLFTVSTFLGAPACWLEDVVVHPDHRAAGIGTALLQAAERIARARGCARITLLTDADNAAAQRLYARHGFAPSPMLAMRRML